MSIQTITRMRAAAVFFAPAVLLASFVYHPYISDLTNVEDTAAAVASDTTRWGVTHLAVALGYALMTLAFLAIRRYLSDRDEERWSPIALPLAVLGSALIIVLPGLEFAPLAAAETGGDVAGAQDALQPWFVPAFITAALTLGLGLLAFAAAVARAHFLAPVLRWSVVVALVVMAFGRFVPLGAAQLVIGIAAVAALWPLAYEMWRRPEVSHMESAGSPRERELRRAA